MQTRRWQPLRTMSRDWFRIVLHAPAPEGLVQFRVFRSPAGGARALVGSGTRGDLASARVAAERMVAFLSRRTDPIRVLTVDADVAVRAPARPRWVSAYRTLRRHAEGTASPRSIRPLAEAIAFYWRQTEAGPAGEEALRQLIRDLVRSLARAARRAQRKGAIFEAQALGEAIEVLGRFAALPERRAMAPCG